MKRSFTSIINRIAHNVSRVSIMAFAIVIMTTAGAFAAGKESGDVSKSAMKAFNRDFSSAKKVSMEQNQGFVKITFSLNDQVLFAYYSNEGELRAVVRNLVSDQLPINLYTTLKNGFSGYWISDLFEVASNDQTTYYVTLENADQKVVLSASTESGWEVYAKSKKTAE